MSMKTCLNVVGAAIIKEGKVLALRRCTGSAEVIHKFEFVGGKISAGEQPKEALAREVREELHAEISVGENLGKIRYEYPEYFVNLSVYVAELLSDFSLTEHEEARWADCSSLDASDWAPADRAFINILKKGVITYGNVGSEADAAKVTCIAEKVMHESFDDLAAAGQIDYMIGLFLTPEKIRENIAEKQYSYRIIYLNGEAAGFYAHCPAQQISPQWQGLYLSKMYLLPFARGKKIASKIISSMRRPIYLTVKRNNTSSINLYKHLGFKIIQSVDTDIGGGYTLDNFVMCLK